MIVFLLALLAFVAVALGVRGDTWDKKQTGIKRITWVGWAALATGLVAAILTCVNDYLSSTASATKHEESLSRVTELVLLLLPLTTVFRVRVSITSETDEFVSVWGVVMGFGFGMDTFLRALSRNHGAAGASSSSFPFCSLLFCSVQNNTQKHCYFSACMFMSQEQLRA